MSVKPAASPLQTLYAEHHGWIHGWLRRKLGCAFDAADLAHDTFVRLMQRDLSIELREPRAYLTTIAHGLMVNHLRRRDLEQAYLQSLAALPIETAPSPEQRAIILETLLQIDRLLADLPPRVRRAFLLNQLDGRSHAEIATDVGVSVSSVRQYIARALRHCLSAQEAMARLDAPPAASAKADPAGAATAVAHMTMSTHAVNTSTTIAIAAAATPAPAGSL